MIALLSTVFVTSLLGSAHCAGMCGGIVAFLSGAGATDGDPTARARAARQMAVAYHFGRAFSYAALGAVAGLAGQALDLGGEAVGIGRAAILAAGAAMLSYGVVTLLRLRGVRVRLPRPRFAEALWKRAFARFSKAAPIARGGGLGLLTALLPCGWLYLFAVTAAGTGSMALGALVMVAFWAGTVPALALVGFGARRLSGPLQRRMPAFSATLLVALGLWALVGHFHVPSFAAAGAAGQSTPACCEPAAE